MPAVEFPRTPEPAYRIEVDINDAIETGKIYDQHWVVTYDSTQISNTEAITAINEALQAMAERLDLEIIGWGRPTGNHPEANFSVIYRAPGVSIYTHKALFEQFNYQLGQIVGSAVTADWWLLVAEWVPKRFPYWLLGVGAVLATIAIGSAVKKRKK